MFIPHHLPLTLIPNFKEQSAKRLNEGIIPHITGNATTIIYDGRATLWSPNIFGESSHGSAEVEVPLPFGPTDFLGFWTPSS